MKDFNLILNFSDLFGSFIGALSDLTNINATEIQDVDKILPEMNTSEDQTTEESNASEVIEEEDDASEPSSLTTFREGLGKYLNV